jgi:cytochrome c553
MKTGGRRLAVAVTAVVLAVDGAGASGIEAGKARSAACVECHGPDGISPHPSTPHLAGQPEAYLAKQILDFRDPMKPAKGAILGGRREALMSHQATGLSEEDAWNLAAWYASLPCGPAKPLPATKPPKTVVQTCNNCHGEWGRSTAPLIPHLAGQPEAYLIRQMRLFQEAARSGGIGAPALREHALMDEYATRLDDAELRAVAAWYARLPCQ